MRLRERLGSPEFRHDLIYSRFLPSPKWLALIVLLFFLASIAAVAIFGMNGVHRPKAVTPGYEQRLKQGTNGALEPRS